MNEFLLIEPRFVLKCRPVFTNHGDRRRLSRWPDLFRFLLSMSGIANPPGCKTGYGDNWLFMTPK